MLQSVTALEASSSSEKVRVAPQLQAVTVPGEGVFLLSEAGTVRVPGPVVELIFEALAAAPEGAMTEEALIETIAARFDYARAYFTLDRLKAQGRLVADWTGSARRLAYDALANLADRPATTVGVFSAAGEIGRSLTGKLQAEGLTLTDSANADLTVVVVQDLLDLEAANAEESGRRDGRATMLVQPWGLTVLVGPIFLPGRTGCWQCLEHRLTRNRQVETYALRRSGAGPLRTAIAATAASVDVALGLAALTASHFLAGEQDGVGEILAFDTLKGRTERHHLRRRPQCPACGDPVATPPGPVTVALGDMMVESAGGFRTVPAEATCDKWRHLVSPLTGVVTHLESFTDPGGVIHNAASGHNMAVAHNLEHLKRGLRSHSSGKGVSEAQARAGALCEGVERYSGVFSGEEFRVAASFEELGEEALHPNDVMLYSERQYAEAEAINARNEPFNRVPLPFDPRAHIDWSPAWSLTRQTQRWLPTSLLYFGYPTPPQNALCWADSNGCAAGNTLAEAILQGFFELVERDAVAIWWYNRLAAPGVDLRAFDLPYIDRMRCRYAELSREIWALDLTSDLGIPVFVALSRRIDKPAEDIIFAFGCHTDPEVAILRALTEMNQFLPVVTVVGADGQGDYAFGDAIVQHWWKTARLVDLAFLAPDPTAPAISRRPSSIAPTRDIGEQVEACRALVETKGLEFMVLDQTRSDVGMPVARVIVPGLRHFWPRFAPGRLYDVPVAQARRAWPMAEEDLNPVAIFV